MAVYGETREVPPRHGSVSLWERWCSQIHKPDGEAGCWVWMGRPNDGGYGRINIAPGVVWLAHRVGWYFAHGDPGEFEVCHHCDNPPCVNPAHLFLGSHLDNMRDMASKGRSAHLSLGEPQILAIRAMCAAGATYNAVGREFGRDASTIRAIVLRHTYRHIA